MVNSQIKRGKASFQTQGRLLQELGERLVAKANVALLELIKNAYDADASKCEVKFDGQRVEIIDDGHGMTETEFLNNWMHIATRDKQTQSQSRIYKRHITGSKGIGRFAVRFLGRYLELKTIALDEKDKLKKLLIAKFDWEQIDKASQLTDYEIEYEIMPAHNDTHSGTTLIIENLQDPKENQLDIKGKTELLSMINPYSGLETGDFGRREYSDRDPGFNVILPKTIEKDKTDFNEKDEINIASFVLKNAYSRLTIEHKNNEVKYLIRHKDGRVLLKKSFEYHSEIKKGFFADIRYFVRRSGMVRNTGFDGRIVLGWLKENGGIGIVDHGFRVRPYGFKDDDWLNLGLDTAHNRREWRSELMNKLYPMLKKASSEAKLNPMLYLPNFHQLVGAVFLESSRDTKSNLPTDIIPSMDREGFVQNEGFKHLYILVRTGLEMLAFADHQEKRRLEEEKKEKETQLLRSDLKEAANYLKTVPGLSHQDRDNIVTRFTSLSKELEQAEEYYRVSTSKLEMMGLLGVMAGFVTHEMQRILNGLERLIKKTKPLAINDKEIASIVNDIDNTRKSIVGQLDYSSAFIGSIHEASEKQEPVNARGAINLIKNQFSQFILERGIDIKIEIDKGVESPPLPRALYNGVVMNLFTNALKASIGGASASRIPKIVFKAWNEPKKHVIEVADNGVGIPPNLRKLIWDPLFTTTSKLEYNPLGSGMGLGLTLVKQIITEVKGRIELVEPPPGFKTCFRVEYPFRR